MSVQLAHMTRFVTCTADAPTPERGHTAVMVQGQGTQKDSGHDSGKDRLAPEPLTPMAKTEV